MKEKPKRKQRISVRSAKNKGKHFQNEIRNSYVELMCAAGYFTTPGERGIESRQMGGSGCDIIFNDRKANELFPYYVECKQGRLGFNPHQIFDNLTQFAKECSKRPIIFHRRDRHETLVTMNLATYVWLESFRLEICIAKEDV